MAAVPKVLYRSAPNSTAAVTTGPAVGYRWIITNLIIVNSTAATTSTATILLNGVTLVALSLAAGQQYILDCRQVLDAGATALSVQTSVASTLNFHISGVEQGV